MSRRNYYSYNGLENKCELIFWLPLDGRSSNPTTDFVSGNTLQQASSYSSSFSYDSTEGAYKFRINGIGPNYAPWINVNQSTWGSIINTGNTHDNYTVTFDIKASSSSAWYLFLIPNVTFGNNNEKKLTVNLTTTSETQYSGIRKISTNKWYRFICYSDFDPSNTTYYRWYIWKIDLSTTPNTVTDIIPSSTTSSTGWIWTQTGGPKATNSANKIYLMGASGNTSKSTCWLRNFKVYKGNAIELINYNVSR